MPYSLPCVSLLPPVFLFIIFLNAFHTTCYFLDLFDSSVKANIYWMLTVCQDGRVLSAWSVWIHWLIKAALRQVQSVLIMWGFCIWIFGYLLKCVCNNKTNSCCAFVAIHRHGQSAGKHEWPNACSQPRLNMAVPCLLVSHAVDDCSLCGLINAPFWGPLWTFLGWFSGLKWPLSTVLECCLAFRSAGRQWCAWWRICMCQVSVFKHKLDYHWLWGQG